MTLLDIFGDEKLCPVCGRSRFDEAGKYEICGVCGWEDDPVQRKDPGFAGGANRMSLRQARLGWLSRSEGPWNWV